MEDRDNKKNKKTIRNLAFFILLIIITFYIILKDQDISKIFSAVINANKGFLLIAVISICMYILCEAINIYRTLKALGEKITLIKTVKYTLIGFFFSSITPAASGGQPMEIYYMHKDNIAVAHSTLALLMQLASFQIISITFGIISAIIHFDVIKDGLIYLVIIGILLNSTALALLIIGIVSKRLSAVLIKFAVKVLKFLKISKIEEKKEKLEKELTKYQDSAIYIKENKLILIKTLITTLIQVIIYFSIPYWIYCALGLNEYNIIYILTLQSVLYATVSGIPSPGAVGVSEGGFLGIFRNLFAPTIINSAMLLNRGISFYLVVIISALVVIKVSITKKDNEAK